MELRFEGHSDDTFGEYDVFQNDYDCCGSGAVVVYKVIGREGDGLYVCGQYGGDSPIRNGCWMIGVKQLDEDVPLPDWPMRWGTSDNGYSPSLIISAPCGTKIECVNRQESCR